MFNQSYIFNVFVLKRFSISFLNVKSKPRAVNGNATLTNPPSATSWRLICFDLKTFLSPEIKMKEKTQNILLSFF